MGLLSQGSPLSWEETQRHADHVRRHGILQFLHIYHAVKDRHKDVLKWGDEVSARPPAPLCSARPRPPRSAPCAARPRGSPRARGRPALSRALPARSLCPDFSLPFIHLGFLFIEQTRSRRWEGVSVPECDTGCLEEFSGWGVCRRRLLTASPSRLKMPLT